MAEQDRPGRQVRVWPFAVLVIAALIMAGAVTVYYAAWNHLWADDDASSRQPLPAPPNDRVTTAPGPDNTVTQAPPPPPEGIPSPPADETTRNPETRRPEGEKPVEESE